MALRVLSKAATWTVVALCSASVALAIGRGPADESSEESTSTAASSRVHSPALAPAPSAAFIDQIPDFTAMDHVDVTVAPGTAPLALWSHHTTYTVQLSTSCNSTLQKVDWKQVIRGDGICKGEPHRIWSIFAAAGPVVRHANCGTRER